MPLPRDPREDYVQAAALARWQAERAEARAERREARILLAGIIAFHGAAYTVAIILAAVCAVAWHDTGDRRFAWPILLIAGALSYGLAFTTVTHREVEL